MPPPASVVELVERFDSNLSAYRSGGYNEAQLRQEFLNPFFEAIGWDIYNKKGYAEAYKEVIHKAAVKVGGRTKAPDYCFRAGGGVRRFSVEAKKPSLDIALRNRDLSQRDLNFMLQRTIDRASEESPLIPNTGVTPLTFTLTARTTGATSLCTTRPVACTPRRFRALSICAPGRSAVNIHTPEGNQECTCTN